MPLLDPSGLVFPASVLQVKHRVARLRRGIVAWRRIHQRVAPVAGHARVVPDLAHLAVRNLLRKVKRHPRFRNLDCARVLAAPIERMAARVAHFRAVHNHRVIVKSRRQWRRGHRPESIRLLLHIQLRSAPQVEPHFRCIGSFHPEFGFGGTVHSRVLRARDVCRGRLKTTRFLSPTQAGRQEHNHYQALHFSSSDCGPVWIPPAPGLVGKSPLARSEKPSSKRFPHRAVFARLPPSRGQTFESYSAASCKEK